MNAVYFGTILVETNRWAAEKRSSLDPAAWVNRAAADGFDGVELWEYHAVQATPAQRDAIRQARIPVAVFSAYVSFGGAGAAGREQAAAAIRDVGARAVKFNLSKDPAAAAGEVAEARRWFAALPGVKPLCECHPGSSVETPAAAAEVFATWPEVGVIIHPFAAPLALLEEWFVRLGERVLHAHVQARGEGNRMARLAPCPGGREAAALLRRHGYRGSFTLEFTEGVNVKPEDAEQLYRHALEDRETLREWLG